MTAVALPPDTASASPDPKVTGASTEASDVLFAMPPDCFPVLDDAELAALVQTQATPTQLLVVAVAAGANMPNFSRVQNADGFGSKSIASR
jgi:hypothetical protein